jgi:Tfp pilus assembly protein PilX
MTKRDNDGFILITVLLLLLVLTILGIAAINTSTVENVLSGNVRLRERNLSKADAGAEISSGLIERSVRESDITGFTNIVSPTFASTSPDYLPNELRAIAFDPDTQDLAFTVDSQNVTVDIDKMYSKWIGGTAIEFASGYEGAGKSAGSGFYTFYRINATGFGLVLSNADVGTIYRYVPR